ncbi:MULTISPECIES: ferritin [unclassified Fusibacter]|uniref:ferritin n=1 Tax=unclassified Fusibacter TaxID=2624464 RepID=UPI001011BA30|nr:MULTISPECIES: ferritin [unclassified Fusibacter]MCK8059256.1 ferritin [Fusibacter sp. A2]NPE21280.1 ferritin [Fusibacter sp. A1]RXV62545.1 ferritin [Fusibacter sp. A1]
MLKDKLNQAYNKQINAEFYSAFLYLSMSAYFENRNLPGFANWMRIQFEEEQFHALKFYNYVNERGGRVVLEAMDQPITDWDNMIHVFEETLKHEEHVTSLINDLMALAIEERDYASTSFLQWFIDEQVEEESNVNSILDQLKLINGEGHAVLMLDRELATRTFVPPTNA